jgi:hypothetical protein
MMEPIGISMCLFLYVILCYGRMFCDGIWGLESFRKFNEQIEPIWPSWSDKHVKQENTRTHAIPQVWFGMRNQLYLLSVRALLPRISEKKDLAQSFRAM